MTGPRGPLGQDHFFPELNGGPTRVTRHWRADWALGESDYGEDGTTRPAARPDSGPAVRERGRTRIRLRQSGLSDQFGKRLFGMTTKIVSPKAR